MMETLRARKQLVIHLRSSKWDTIRTEPPGTEGSSRDPGEGVGDLPWLSWQNMRRGELSFDEVTRASRQRRHSCQKKQINA